MSTFVRNYQKILGEVGDKARVVVVTKNQAVETIRRLYETGCRLCGENRVNELLEKKEALPDDIEWHLIGHLQTNKVRKVVGEVALIHSVDSLELAKKIGEVSKEKGVETPILLQVNTSGERTKFGFSPESILEEYPLLRELQGIRIQGFMTMAPLVADPDLLRQTFRRLVGVRDTIRSVYPGDPLQEFSMGMSHDYPIALEEEATFIRIGSAIFSD